MSNLAVGYEDSAFRLKAESIAHQLNIPIDNNASICLWVFESGLGLKKKGYLPVICDFNFKTWQKKSQTGKKQGLVKACSPVKESRIIDISAGWGRDAAILASLGAHVQMIERNPLMAMILEDALNRRDLESMERMDLSLIHMDAGDYLSELQPQNYPSIIYFDPMHPSREKSALVKKDLQILQDFIGKDEDAYSVLLLALQKATQKVVVKWPQGKPGLIYTDTSIPGKTVRFDMYRTSMTK